MDEQKLQALREKYAEGKGGDMFDPDFRRVADLIFAGTDRRAAPFSGVPTFLDAPYTPDAADDPAFNGLEIALIGVPMDLGVTNRSGARFGPRAVRAIERVGPYHHVLKTAPIHERRVADVGDVPFRSRFDLNKSIEDIEEFYDRVRRAGVIPVSVGGDHSITYPIQKALGREQPVGMVHIDAHCDTAGQYEGEKFHHGGPFRHAVLSGALDPERTVQIGIRGSSEYHWEFSYESGMTVIHAEEFHRDGVEAAIARTLEVIGDGPTYISIDVDGIDPAYAPGTGTPEIGGLTPREVQILLRALAGRNLIGGDVVEVAPQYDTTTNTAHLGAQMAFEIVSLIATSPALGGAP